MKEDKEKPKLLSGVPPLLLIVGCFLTLSLIYLSKVPPFEGPDEAQHFAYVSWLARGRGLPPQGDAAWTTPIEQEASQPPFYYLLASLPARLVDLDNPPATYRPNPYFAAPLPRETPDNDNRAVHYPAESGLRGGWLAFYLARSVTLAFGVLLVIGVYGLAREVVPRVPAVAWASSLLVATMPQVLFVGTVVSNDIPAAALATLTLWFLARLLRRDTGSLTDIALGMIFGLAVLTKVSSFILVLPLALGFGWLWFSERDSLRVVGRKGLLFAGSAFATAGWWFIRSWSLYGSPLGLNTHDATPWAITAPEQNLAFHLRWLEIARSYWIALGWGTIRPPGWVYQVLFALVLVAAVGWARACWQWWRHSERRPDTPVVLRLLLAGTVLLAAVMLEVWMRRVQAPLGRLLFPAIGALSLLLVLGWRRLHAWLPFLVTAFVGLVSLLAPFLILQPAFARPTLLSPAQVERLPERLGLRFGPEPGQPVAELLSVTPASTSHSLDSRVLPVEVCWRALDTTDRDYTVFLHLIGPENRLVANRRSYPGMGRYPTSLWRPGDAFCDQMHVRVDEEDVPRTLRYLVEVGLLEEATGERLRVFDGDGQPVAGALVDEVVVRKGGERRPVPAQGAALQLLDYELPRRWHSGQEHRLRLQWGVSTPVADDYQIFVHLRDLESGRNVAQADGPPLAGWYPTSYWEEGEVVVEERTFPLSAHIPGGRYRLLVGFYDLESGIRVGEAYDLGLVTVEP